MIPSLNFSAWAEEGQSYSQLRMRINLSPKANEADKEKLVGGEADFTPDGFF